jgi:predicted metal-binding protein
MIRKVMDKVPVETLQSDLEKYRQKALEAGASEAKVITTDTVIVDERVRAKCMNPKCTWYGTNGNCPPHAPDLEMVRKIVENYQYAIFILTKHPPETFVTENLKTSLPQTARLKSHEIVGRVEASAFHDGYYLASGLADGPCKNLYCLNVECAVLKGDCCRQGVKARYSMESWGMDAYRMATRVGWEIYPTGGATQKTDLPYSVTLGLVFIY